jgi:hypothetical protein
MRIMATRVAMTMTISMEFMMLNQWTCGRRGMIRDA